MDNSTLHADDFNYFKLDGAKVEDGGISITSLREFIDGLEKTTKYFITSDNPSLAKNGFEIEIRISAGSIRIDLVKVIVVGAALLYSRKALETMAENDIGDKSSKQVLYLAMCKIKSTVLLAKHFGGMGVTKYPKYSAIDKDNIFVWNEADEKIKVTKSQLDTYQRAPKDVFKKLADIVDADTTLYFLEAGEVPQSNGTVIIDRASKQIFGSDTEADDEITLPELQNGERVTLKGALCRANTNTRTLGFRYKGHTLTSYLFQMEISNIKDALFDKEVEIEAIVLRTQQKSDSDEELKRPKLEIRSITTLGELIEKVSNLKLTD